MLWASLIVENIGRLWTMDGSGAHGVGAIDDAVVLIDADRIAWVGPRAALPVPDLRGVPRLDAGGRAALPGLIDCHTHALFLGSRADEFARRARGESYAQIMAAGGGIRSTRRAVRGASEDELCAATRPRLAAMVARGVTTVEVKSGYGLSVDSELSMLRAARRLAKEGDVDVVSTLLAAHAVPPEHEGRGAEWIELITRELLPEVAKEKLATACDVFVEAGAFSADEARPMLRRAQELGLGVRVHAEQLSRSGGAALAAELGAWSAGHLEHVAPEDMEALARAGVVCEVLALAQVFLRGQRATPGRALIDAGCTVAVATDCNPGTAMSTDLPLAAGMAVTQCGLSAEEALHAITDHAARALRLPDRGVIAAGKRADLLIVDGATPLELVYRWGDARAHAVVAQGKQVVKPPR
ncbi:MAG: imidazolonepropionase [Deltaproteobacteria bacterium]|nr:imidazolonepropionase [Deltaproteobacteria bacterium]